MEDAHSESFCIMVLYLILCGMYLILCGIKPHLMHDCTSFYVGLYLILCGIVPIINALRCKAMSLQQYIVILVRIWRHDGIC